MNEHQIKYLLLSAIILGIVFKKNFNKFYIYQNRKMNLDSISDCYFLSSDRIKQAREMIDGNKDLIHYDNKVTKNIDLFINSYTKDELLLLKKNIETLKVKSDSKIIDLFDGIYDIDDNIIISSDNAFNHEMHHVASTLGIVDGVKVSGFMQDKLLDGKNKCIGIGINEGYTEYLSLNQVNTDNIYYEKIVDIIPLIELFFDNPKDLRMHYFNADLESVINRFSLVCGKDDSINLIKDIDRLVFYDSFKTWFDKTELIDLSIRLRLLEYYERLSGNINCKELFLPYYVTDNLTKAKKLIM